MKRITEDGYKRTNREMSQEPRGKAFWCWGCDGCRVANGATCIHCGATDPGSRAKSGKPVVND